jgi:hypothetical protein
MKPKGLIHECVKENLTCIHTVHIVGLLGSTMC